MRKLSLTAFLALLVSILANHRHGVMSKIKKKTMPGSLSIFLLMMVLCLMFTGCKKEESSMVPDNWLDNSYKGTLTVRSTNVYPEWDVTTQMDVEIEKQLGTVSISSATLNYSGETIISGDSKIERTGSWQLIPTGELQGKLEDPNVYIDAGVIVQIDVQKIYAKDNSGEWKLVNSTDFSGETPNSDLSFNLNQAVISGATISASGNGGSLTWTLIMVVALD